MYTETNLKNFARKILQALNVREGDSVVFSVTQGGYILIMKEKREVKDWIDVWRNFKEQD